ncbi:RNA 2',3'-cyclic phosphodiesterase [soil metagenome]
MKLFSAVRIPQRAIDQIRTQTESLFDDYPSYNWVPLHNYHVSLHYIGEVTEAKLPIAVEHIQNKLYDVPVTNMYTYGADLFMDEQITIYIYFQRNKTIEDISRRLYDLFEAGSLKKRKEYIPHITIARYKIPSKQQYFLLKKKLAKLKVDVEFAVEDIHLYESIETRKNPQYKIVASIPLLNEKK